MFWLAAGAAGAAPQGRSCSLPCAKFAAIAEGALAVLLPIQTQPCLLVARPAHGRAFCKNDFLAARRR